MMTITKEDKERISEIYFKGIKIKYLKKFRAETPQGNIIEGLICKKPNHHLGSMVIMRINDRCLQYFVQAMPKIHYYSHKKKMFEEVDVPYYCSEKLDGSCLILYGLYTPEGELMEVVPKTRGLPVADKHIIELYNEIDHSNVEEFFKHNFNMEPTLMFELYGMMNLHSIQYPEVRISTALLGGTINGDFISWYELEYFARQYDFKLPNRIFSIVMDKQGFWNIYVQPGIYFHYLLKGMTEEQRLSLEMAYPTQYDTVTAVKDYITKINKSYSEVHGKKLLEGVVVNTFSEDTQEPMFMKIKSAEIEEKCRTQEGIPRKFILKEAYKYFDEYGSEAKEIYKKDEYHGYNYIMNGLSEEFDEEALENSKTKRMVKKVFLDVLEAKQPPKGLQEICHAIIEEYPDQEPVDYIRIFADEYPEKKRIASLAYNIFEALCRKNSNQNDDKP